MFGTTSFIRPYIVGFVVFVGGALEWLGIDSQKPSELFDNGKGLIKKRRRGFNAVERLEQPLYQTKELWPLLCKIV